MTNLLRISEGDVPDWLRSILLSNGNEWDGFHYRQAIQPLIRYGLLQRLGGKWAGTTMHHLVQWRARKANQESDTPWARWTWLFIIAAVCQTNRDKGNTEFRRHVIAHLIGMGAFDVDSNHGIHLDKESMASLWAELAEVYYDEGRWKEAEELGVQVMETSRRVLGQEHPSTLTRIANLARM